jgi:hypothetical protein
MVQDRKEMTVVKQAHTRLGHVNRLQTLDTANKCSWKIKDLNKIFTCEVRQIVKAKRMTVRKVSRITSNINLMKLKPLIIRYFLWMMNARMKWSFFLANKSIQPEILLNFIKELRSLHNRIVTCKTVPMKTTVWRIC